MHSTHSRANLKTAGCFLWLSLVVILSTSCDGKNQAAGDCHYETIETLAEVIDMRPHHDGDGRIAIYLDFKASILALEDQELGDLKEIKIDHEFLTRNNIQLNTKYEVTVSELIKGDCKTKLTVAFDSGFE
jgi:hypothetical protein